LLGAFIFNIQKSNQYYFSWIFILIIIGIIFIARLINVYLLSLIGYCIVGKDKWRLNHYEYQIIFVSGLVKGAVPFALIMGFPILKGRP